MKLKKNPKATKIITKLNNLWYESQIAINLSKSVEGHETFLAIESFREVFAENGRKIILKDNKNPYGHVFWLKCRYDFKL